MRRALVAVLGGLVFALAPLAAATSSYSDPSGDAGSGPDVTRVVVSSSDGLVTFRVHAALVPAAVVGEYTLFGTDLDTDLDRSTGDDVGAEQRIVVALHPDGRILQAGVRPPGDPHFTPGVRIDAGFDAGVLTYTFQRRALGIDAGFRFRIYTLNMSHDDQLIGGEWAPDRGLWAYPVIAPRPVVGQPWAVPARPVAGKRFTVAFPVTRSDTGARLARARLSCTTTVAGKVVPHRHAYTTGRAQATLVVPKTARGKVLRISVTVRASGHSATKVVRFRIW